MKMRQFEILRLLLNHRKLIVSDVIYLYDISMRTLYYDIEQINYMIDDFGKLRIEDNYLVFDGDVLSLYDYFEKKLMTPYFESKERQDLILLSILEDNQRTLDEYASMFEVSKTTIFSDVEGLKSDLLDRDIRLFYKKKYYLSGNEWNIRDCYLKLLEYKPFSFEAIDERVILFNESMDLRLSDYSMYYLSEFTRFVKQRIEDGFTLDSFTNELEVDLDDIDLDVDYLIEFDDHEERNYLKAYIASFTGIKHGNEDAIVSEYVDVLLKEIQMKLALNIEWDHSFKESLKNHLLASYYRIGFSFPASNPSLKDIKLRYFSLYNGIKKIVRTLPVGGFNQMRDEEIGFVTAYVGGYIERYSYVQNQRCQVILVCPQGRAVSNYLKYQIQNLSSEFEVLGSYSIDSLGKLMIDYNYIITTVDLPYFKNVIQVNPVLSDVDRAKLLSLVKNNKGGRTHEVDRILSVVEKHAKIFDRKQLTKSLINLLSEENYVESIRRQPMLSELLTERRIRRLESVSNWQEGIMEASQPLLEDGSIEQVYVDAMINSVNEFGPYIVLANEFALPHASNVGGVNELAMSMLVLDEPVDMRGKDVRIFMVLATIDNQSHLKALSSMTDLISDDETLAWIKSASPSEIRSEIEKREVKE